MEKEAEIVVKQRQYEMLKKKAERIESKKQAIMKYENFLEEVQKENTDEFQEVNDILTRYDTLVRENQKLDKDHHALEQKLKQMKDNTNKYIKDKQTEIMKLNNETT